MLAARRPKKELLCLGMCDAICNTTLDIMQGQPKVNADRKDRRKKKADRPRQIVRACDVSAEVLVEFICYSYLVFLNLVKCWLCFP